ncbi:MAG: hypothetical protein ACLFSQ_06030 [Candidatus Zixiibacteriota bacterium]
MYKSLITLLVLCAMPVFASQFDISNFDYEKYGHYKYKVLADGKSFTEEIQWSKLDSDDFQVEAIRNDKSGDLHFRKQIIFDSNANPKEAYRYTKDGKIEIEVKYDYDKKKVYMKKLDGNSYDRKTLKLVKGLIQDGFALLYTVNFMDFDKKISFTGYSATVQKSGSMNFERIGTKKLATKAGEFECYEYKQAFDGLLSLVVPKMYYYIDKETRVLVKFEVSDTSYELVEILK